MRESKKRKGRGRRNVTVGNRKVNMREDDTNLFTHLRGEEWIGGCVRDGDMGSVGQRGLGKAFTPFMKSSG